VVKIKLEESRHFTLEKLAIGVYACVHKSGGGAFSNAGIIDLGDKTIVVDAFDTMAAGCDLHQTAETLFGRPVERLLLTHSHSDHWIGASVFDETTVLMASKKTRQISKIWGTELVKDFKKRSTWEKQVKKLEEQLQSEQDERVRISLEKSIRRLRYTLVEMANFEPRYADQTFDGTIDFQGSERALEFRSMGRGHSEDDSVVLLPQDKIAFIGDIGFFDTQPFLGFCDLELHRKQLHFFQNSDYQVLVPGHGPVGNVERNIGLQLDYLAVMENLVGEVVRNGGSLKEAKRIILPEPFDKWLIGGMNRFEINVQYFYKHLGGETRKK